MEEGRTQRVRENVEASQNSMFHPAWNCLRNLSLFPCLILSHLQFLFHRLKDGITEIEEALEANVVERRLNDDLLSDEREGRVVISRKPAFVGCVSNFSNFLDLCRKVCRNIELGIPVVIFSRSNTTQHMFRWFQLLVGLCEQFQVDVGLVTYFSGDIDKQRFLISKFPTSPLYLTGSRPIAQSIKDICPKLMASTGGPNTMVIMEQNSEIEKAASLSCTIENSGQCTAARHLVTPYMSEEKVVEMLGNGCGTSPITLDSFERKEFAKIIESFPFKLREGYKKHPELNIAYKVSDSFPAEIDENWREVYVDVTQVEDFRDNKFVEDLSRWVNHHQPISIATNGGTYQEAFELAKKLFERTGVVVYTIGSRENPALTAQARPQDGEIFGEFPPRASLHQFTKFPVIVPSSTPGYNTVYSDSFLLSQSKLAPPAGFEYIEAFITRVEGGLVRGYLRTMIDHLIDSVGPKTSYKRRTSLWGLQRAPLGCQTEIRVSATTNFDDFAIYLLPFIVTNAYEQVTLSCDPSRYTDISNFGLPLEGVKVLVETLEVFEKRVGNSPPWNVIRPLPVFEFPLVGHFLSLLLPIGHVKSTRSRDEEFVRIFFQSSKWLQTRLFNE
eukprot:TRINITY_DN827_c0_g1_i12.p1 TRINITY_DN827_c0_g1~~TRINITY_DN827_c0_g1_i12.p1  ORF type:complete len:614 (+),score=115.61 TRINITY_DN827_c0_g1_i12:622-2463(+)